MKTDRTILLEDSRDFLTYREGSGGTIEIFEIVVGSERRRGRGKALISKLLDEVKGETSLVFAITRESNGIARDFYRAVGFRTIAVLGRFYPEGDAVMYGLDLET